MSINDVIEGLYEGVGKKLEDKLYDRELYNLGGYDITRNVLHEFIEDILKDEKMKVKLVNKASKAILDKHKENEKKRKVLLAKNTKLWNITKGKIPCLNECGYHDQMSKDEVLYNRSNNFICSECCRKLESEDKYYGVSKVFDTKNVYQIYNIK